jgi:hypothetical protein
MLWGMPKVAKFCEPSVITIFDLQIIPIDMNETESGKNKKNYFHKYRIPF